jgi:hypothetical protein
MAIVPDLVGLVQSAPPSPPPIVGPGRLEAGEKKPDPLELGALKRVGLQSAGEASPAHGMPLEGQQSGFFLLSCRSFWTSSFDPSELSAAMCNLYSITTKRSSVSSAR